MKGFKNFLMRGDVIVVAVGLVIALAFSGLITAFTTNIINPIVSRFQGGKSLGLGAFSGAGRSKKNQSHRRFPRNLAFFTRPSY